ncbi:MAG: Rrf2 family transcriptional regulator [Trueperaceae bacterium]|nr:Rrf2 family transcriptional regulator [Trueperaceae bacterium]
MVRTLMKREESYAVHALLYLHEYPGAPASQVAADLQIPAAFTAKVLRRLGASGLVEAKAGRTGGVHLRIPLTELTLLDVVEAVSGPLMMDTCQTKARCATQQRKGYCRLNTAWVALSLEVREALRAVRLDQLADPPADDPSAHGRDGTRPTERGDARTARTTRTA